MEQVAGWLDGLMAWWASLPPVPDLGLPPAPDPDALIAIATVVTGLACVGLVSGWIEKRLSLIAVFSLLFGIALFIWVWDTDRAAWDLIRIPEAFVNLAARVLR